MGPEYFWMNGMWLFPLLGLTFVISIIYLVFGKKSYDKDTKTNNSALDILKKRLAKGEITKEEFNDIKKEIE